MLLCPNHKIDHTQVLMFYARTWHHIWAVSVRKFSCRSCPLSWRENQLGNQNILTSTLALNNWSFLLTTKQPSHIYSLLSKYRQGVVALSKLGMSLQLKRWLMKYCLHLKVETLPLMYTVPLTNWWLRLLMKIRKTGRVQKQ